jgi:hypothetical protein
MTSDDREYLLRANSDWPWVLVPLMGMVFVLGVGRPVPGDPFGPGSISLRSTEPLRVSSAHAVTIPIAGEE